MADDLNDLPVRLLVAIFCMGTIVAATTLSREAAAVQAELVPAQDTALLGGGRAQGAVIWSHGRSRQEECDLAPTPDYIGAFRAGRDTFRLNRSSIVDTLQDSAVALAGAAEALKHRGYRRVVLAGEVVRRLYLADRRRAERSGSRLP